MTTEVVVEAFEKLVEEKNPDKRLSFWIMFPFSFLHSPLEKLPEETAGTPCTGDLDDLFASVNSVLSGFGQKYTIVFS